MKFLSSTLSFILVLITPIVSNLAFEEAQYSSISFDTNGGSSISPRTFKVGDRIEISETTKEGFTFVDWYTDDSFVKPFILTIMPARDIRIYAKWDAELYSINFDTNGGNSISSIQGYFGESIPLPNNPIRLGHTFEGWYRDSNYNNYFNLSSFPSMNMTLHAKWLINQYNIQFITNGGNTIQSQTKNYNVSLSIPTPTKVGHSFAGWFTDVGLTQTFTLTNMPAQNFTLYAKWIINQYIITFNTNGGIIETEQTNEYGSELTLLTPTKLGHTFVGWFTDINLSQAAPATMPAQDITLYAKWNINQYTITFVTNDENPISNETYYFGQPLTLPTPTKPSHTFFGWFTDIHLSQAAPATMPAQALTLYAKWVIFYTITFNTNGGNTISDETYYFADALTLPTPTKQGYTFAGWFTDIDFSQAAPATMPAQDITLYANWSINQYTISFNTNGGSTIVSITGNFGDSVIVPSNPTKEGHSFQGWYSDASLTIPTTILSHIPSFNIVYFAKWITLTYTVTWTNYNGSVLQRNYNVPYGTMPTYSGSTPTRPPTYHVIPWEYWRSYTFAGWSPSRSPVQSNQNYVAIFS